MAAITLKTLTGTSKGQPYTRTSGDVVQVMFSDPNGATFVIRLDLSQGPRWLRGKTWDPTTRHKNEIGDLRTAGITRSELFERTASRQPIRLHDLRATFVTVSLANGKTEQWVMDRTGHRSSQMIALYARQARTWAELNLGPLLPLDTLLPEMRREASQTRPSRQPASHAPPPRRGRRLERATSGPRIAPTAGLEPATRRLTEPQTVTQSEWLRQDESQAGYEDLAVDSRCFTVRQDDSSGNVRRSCVHCMGPLPSGRIAALPEVPATSEDALRLAIKLAVNAGEYERAAGVLDVLRIGARARTGAT
jgi:hypothetical protein